MTKDRVTLRLNLAAVYRVADARRLATVARAPVKVLYLAVQLSAREAVATRTLDYLLAAREELGQALRPAGGGARCRPGPRAARSGPQGPRPAGRGEGAAQPGDLGTEGGG